VVSELHPPDEKVLTAKAIAYEVLTRRELSLRNEREDRFRELESSIASIENLPSAGAAHVSLDKFLQEVDQLRPRMVRRYFSLCCAFSVF
jgi:hypothetical protein